MGEDNKPNIFNGKRCLFFAEIGDKVFKELPIVEDSVSFKTDDIKVREQANLDPTIHDTINKFAEVQPCSIFDIIFGGIEPNLIRQFVFENFPEPSRKPSNLKYPNKKRKMRVWKKWCNRYGWKNPRYIVIPRARCNGVVLKDGVPTFSYTAEEFSK